jgi:hypothetical protein
VSVLDAARDPSLTPRQYRWLDRVTKLLGLALIAAGLEVGGTTTAGIVLAALGVASGLTTVVIQRP